MINSPITIVGRICSDPVYIGTKDNSDGVLKIRIASSRSYRQDEKWHNTDQLYINVEAWGRLAVNAHQSLTVGVSVIVHGMLYTNQWETVEANSDKPIKRQEVRLRALSIGIDLNSYLVGFVDARPRLENVPHGVVMPENRSASYTSGDTRQDPDNQEHNNPEAREAGERGESGAENQLVNAGAPNEPEQ
ncbi:single-stranded DNA-binding protein [Corynebacterium callunae]|uniref:single-stranded DNA-binding protein n=1 Tax=Corynebacterium callunae TaxID=1721 RepID=UPI0039827AEC